MKAIMELNTGRGVDYELAVLSLRGLKATPITGVWKGIKNPAYIVTPTEQQIKEVIRVAKAHHQDSITWMDEHGYAKRGRKERNYFPVGKAMKLKPMSLERAADLDWYTIYQGTAYAAA